MKIRASLWYLAYIGWNFILRVSVLIVPMVTYMITNMRWGGFLCCEGTPDMLLVANLFGECNTGLCMVVITELMSYLHSCVLHWCSSLFLNWVTLEKVKVFWDDMDDWLPNVLCNLLLMLSCLRTSNCFKLRVLMCELMLTHLRLLTRNNCKVLSNFGCFWLLSL